MLGLLIDSSAVLPAQLALGIVILLTCSKLSSLPSQYFGLPLSCLPLPYDLLHHFVCLLVQGLVGVLRLRSLRRRGRLLQGGQGRILGEPVVPGVATIAWEPDAAPPSNWSKGGLRFLIGDRLNRHYIETRLPIDKFTGSRVGLSGWRVVSGRDGLLTEVGLGVLFFLDERMLGVEFLDFFSEDLLSTDFVGFGWNVEGELFIFEDVWGLVFEPDL